MKTCTNCNGKVISKGSVVSKGKQKNRYKCTSCSMNFYFLLEQEEVVVPVKSVKKYVITSCQNNSDVNSEFLENLNFYCTENQAELIIVPIVYKAEEYERVEYHFAEEYQRNLSKDRLRLHDEVVLLGNLNFLPTTVNPLSSLETLSKGNSLIVPSPQLRMKTLALSASHHPAILITTGSISRPNYSVSKSGEKARFNHSYSAVILEIDSDNDYHIRILNADEENGFFDVGYYYQDGAKTFETIEAIITGDEHAIFSAPDVKKATYTNPDSMVNTLKPKYIVRHDVLDCYSVSHHHKKDAVLSYGKHLFAKNLIEDELEVTISYINETTPKDYEAKNVIVSSNHNDHLLKWLKETDIKYEPWNAKIYHELMWKVLDTVESSESGISYENPFKLYCSGRLAGEATFLSKNESFVLHSIELGAHGDIGTNGSRGSLLQYSNLAQKYVIGHSHTPGIIYGAYQVGTSSIMKMEYNNGPSSWLQSHCIIAKNGKRQLINIINGKWKA